MRSMSTMSDTFVRELAGHGYPIVDRLAEAAKRRPTEQPQSPKFSQIKEEDEDIHDSGSIVRFP